MSITNEAEFNKERSNHLILGFFFLTGLTGLAYELVWIRLLILAFGSTQFAITTVLVVFTRDSGGQRRSRAGETSLFLLPLPLSRELGGRRSR